MMVRSDDYDRALRVMLDNDIDLGQSR